jgi:hypothetical protein
MIAGAVNATAWKIPIKTKKGRGRIFPRARINCIKTRCTPLAEFDLITALPSCRQAQP